MRPIDADRLKERIKKLEVESFKIKTERIINRTIQELFPQIIDDEPTLDYAPVKRGHWEKEEDFIGKKYRCTMCKKVIRYDREYVCQGELIFDFCPFCSADMRGEEHEQDQRQVKTEV